MKRERNDGKVYKFDWLKFVEGIQGWFALDTFFLFLDIKMETGDVAYEWVDRFHLNNLNLEQLNSTLAKIKYGFTIPNVAYARHLTFHLTQNTRIEATNDHFEMNPAPIIWRVQLKDLLNYLGFKDLALKTLKLEANVYGPPEDPELWIRGFTNLCKPERFKPSDIELTVNESNEGYLRDSALEKYIDMVRAIEIYLNELVQSPVFRDNRVIMVKGNKERNY